VRGAQVLKLEPPSHPGRLLTAKEVAQGPFSGKVSARWVKENLRAGRWQMGHRKVVWSETDVLRWIAQQIEAQT